MSLEFIWVGDGGGRSMTVCCTGRVNFYAVISSEVVHNYYSESIILSQSFSAEHVTLASISYLY